MFFVTYCIYMCMCFSMYRQELHVSRSSLAVELNKTSENPRRRDIRQESPWRFLNMYDSIRQVPDALRKKSGTLRARKVSPSFGEWMSIEFSSLLEPKREENGQSSLGRTSCGGRLPWLIWRSNEQQATRMPKHSLSTLLFRSQCKKGSKENGVRRASNRSKWRTNL